ncbi:MAG: hypothetical protein F6J89_17205 [Symploca sp. SIO1C4]|uniref:Type I restriction enzyme R protein N-terminal domain-containing protein n=1 Tax=Symploca sp. SIO1C4 TaxID=2607765 RepID=A0A6B3N855_9CYAN|nr:hypothetical protein [Symploca sp. SIO1C4]NET05613.1 hypothetical protein [Symploca sp. SIO2B6]NET50572.1 hypothetical protein [Merismopedia sp. SIO2A8]
MSRVSIIQPDQSYNFADYFKLNYDIEDILSYFGYSFQPQLLTLPKSQRKLEQMEQLKQRFQESLPYLSLNSEIARREFLIAPVIMELIHYIHVKVRVEYPLAVNNQLKGTLDYYLQSENQLLVIEAKNADLQRGFTQLGVELIAIDQWFSSENPKLYGAVSMGNIWQFGVLHRQTQKIIQDINLYRVPADLEDLLRILVEILNPSP